MGEVLAMHEGPYLVPSHLGATTQHLGGGSILVGEASYAVRDDSGCVETWGDRFVYNAEA